MSEFYAAIAQYERLLSHKNFLAPHMFGLLALLSRQMLSHNFKAHVVLGAGNPNHSSPMQMVKMGEVHIRLVEHHYFTCPDRRTQFPCHLRIGILCAIHQYEIR